LGNTCIETISANNIISAPVASAAMTMHETVTSTVAAAIIEIKTSIVWRKWHHIEVKISILFGTFNYNEIEISILRRKWNSNNPIQNLTRDRDDVFWAFRAFVGCCWMSISCGFLNNWVSLGVGVRAQKLMVMMCLGILAHLAVLGCYNINSGHDDGDTQIEHVRWDSASQQNFSPRFVPNQVLMMSSGANPGYLGRCCRRSRIMGHLYASRLYPLRARQS
jgi:hypothetical protein